MLKKVYALTITASFLGLTWGAGCNAPEHEPWTANDMNSQKMDEAKARNDPHWRQMADNAMISDMTVADFHFVPHTAELSGSGVERLSRLAPYLESYGGTVRYDALIRSKELIEARLANVREYLESTGTDMSRVEVTAGLSGGRSTPASDLIRIEDKGTAKPQGSSGSTTVIGSAPNP